MRHYEIVFMVHPAQSEQVSAMIERYRSIIESSHGVVYRVEDWGRRVLAYSINEVHKAHYVLMNIECSIEILQELENSFRFNDAIIRNLIIKRDKAVSEMSPIAQLKQQELADKAVDVTKKTAQKETNSTPESAVSAKFEKADKAEEADEEADKVEKADTALADSEQSADTQQPEDSTNTEEKS